MIQLVKGTKDIYGAEVKAWQSIEGKMRRLCETFGIGEIRTPAFEFTELFVRGVGETTDIVQKEMYTFTDDGDRSLTLRPEGTAGVVRAYIEHGMHNNAQPTKLYYISPTFRCENTQAGRQRQFHQFGVEMLGSYSAAQDAEAISVAAALLEEMGVKGVELRINSLGCPECRGRYNKKLREFIGSNLDRLCPTCKERFEKNPLRVLDCKEESCQAVIANAPSVLDCLDEECTAHFQKVQDILTEMGIPFVVDPKIVRGLDYYTRTVFEFVSDGLTVCGGGRYDNLVEECGGKPTGAVGFGLGIERLVMILEKQNGAIEEHPERDVYIGSMGEKGLIRAQGITLALRKAGVRAECDTVERSVKAQMKYANKIGAKYSVILGDSELESGQVELKEMETGEKETVSLAELAEVLLKKVK
ncbi:histidine--tRNA ligase [Anaerotignum lactatifermentans]|uniref:Histidine--tRNA ligase n=1 Tax=Anaerotignum lactatifermentans TaxID=160404 RepID=A0ABS2G757_9FIRM|nr:histidine--tRNA ligase [Anaerotignum lactatifermentans]MBM6828249.1 histidine--tRNA ligase [Anaerotignum lactatifermentans]MBM6876588.1 histidine--tRNA ligase [Anaerotignum lactatifermentans]MBM6949832.1 histidine--tRNA ligase [Anaerotignum lactatifermentans]